MSNEELAALILGGERDKLPELWEQVERFVAVQARRRLVLSGGLGGVEFGDLYNAGYLAMVAAVDSFDPDAGRTFIGWLALHLKTAFAQSGGYLSAKQAKDPLHKAGSLDVPVGQDEGGATVGEFIEDPASLAGFERVEDRLYQEHLHAVLEEMLSALPEWQSSVLRRHYNGATLEEIAIADGVDKSDVRRRHEKGLGTLRQDWRKLEQFVESRTPYYRRWSIHSGERTTEMIAVAREGLVGKWVYQNLPGKRAADSRNG